MVDLEERDYHAHVSEQDHKHAEETEADFALHEEKDRSTSHAICLDGVSCGAMGRKS